MTLCVVEQIAIGRGWVWYLSVVVSLLALFVAVVERREGRWVVRSCAEVVW